MDSQPSECKSHFKGTLHVLPKSTVKNVYHAITDNLMPVISLILSDWYESPEYVHLPRMMLTGIESGGGPKDDSVPHLKLLNQLMAAGTVTLSKAEGMCFSRVVWGRGTSLFYADTQVVMRRLCTDFGRLLAKTFFDIKLPTRFEIGVDGERLRGKNGEGN
eukprot:CAMPEP_0119037498 /NCGR_PEP_ID=MMETSP1177-20130426/5884_1 /TAXON_ID=2985 /ORGANISM="Ochromonas sp, Strain CCMP1899" /LENGTH=160 /DNA_ID=CAMNT_0006998839 /DNA_START=652 /DNA_END=1131 /DNA_ORIENTATION=+